MEAVSTAVSAAFSHDSVLVPTSSMILYTLIVISFLSKGSSMRLIIEKPVHSHSKMRLYGEVYHIFFCPVMPGP
ncbi:MAG: hypothetical protein AMK70_04100, partial [Nitrospira bacterium SG8_35_1]